MMISAFLLSAVISLSSCSNSQNNTSAAAQENEHNAHDGHDHSGHDHSHEGTTTNTSTPPPTQKEIEELAQKAPAQTIPAFKFYKVKSGISFTNADIPKGKKTALILFDPNCSHCQSEAGQLAKNYSKIKDVNIYFVSMNDPALMANFLETFAKELVGKPNIEVLYDKNQDFIQKIHVPKQFPANYVYGADQQLQTYWDGDKKINDIIAAYTK